MSITEQTMDLVEFIKNYWAVIAFIGGVITQWAVHRGTLTDHERRIEKLETNEDARSIILADIQTRLASIQTTLEFLTNKKK